MERAMKGLVDETSDSRTQVEDNCEMRFTVQRCDNTRSNGHFSSVDRCPSKSSLSFDKNEDSVNTSSSLSFRGHDQTISPLLGHVTAAPDSASFPAEEGRKMAAMGKAYHDRTTRRLVRKDGSCNVTSGHVRKRNRKYLVDIFTTLVDLRWRYIVIIFTAAFVLSWTGFAALWFAIAVAHGDHLHDNDTEWRPCVANVYDFTTALLFSIETQHTIGYGYRVVETTCPGTVAVLMAQSCFGVFIQSLVTGLVFAKLARPKRRAHTIMFSRGAVVCRRNHGGYCLLFRVGDMRKSHFVGTSIRAILVEDKNVEGGETIPLCQTPLDLETDSCRGDNFVFLVWPATVVHRITRNSSALWRVNAETLMKEQLEIIVILEGIVESTGGTTQVRTSYLPSDIFWGYRLAPLLTYQRENGQYEIDYQKFHEVLPTDSMPSCSAEQYHERSGRDPDPEEEFTSACFATSGLTASKRSTVLRRMRSGLKGGGSRALFSARQLSRNSTSSAPETPKKGAAGSEAVNGTGSRVANGTGNETETIKKNGVGSPSS